jgi:hypothetical protein
MEQSNLSFKFLSCERTRIVAKVEFFINTSMYNVCIAICPREIGGSESPPERLEIANWETMHELEREFRVMRKQLGAYEEDLKLHGQVRCEDLRVVTIIIIGRGLFHLQVVKVNVRCEDE